MLFRRKQTPQSPAIPVTDPVVAAQIHWLKSRGLVRTESIGTPDWIAAAKDPADQFSLAEARVDGRLCVEPSPMVTIPDSGLLAGVDAIADGLGLPIDEAKIDEAGTLIIRSSHTHLSFETADRALFAVLSEVAAEFVDSAHRLISHKSTFAIVHRDVAEQAEAALHERTRR